MLQLRIPAAIKRLWRCIWSGLRWRLRGRGIGRGWRSCGGSGGSWGSVVGRRALKTDHWFYGLFQSAPDLIALLLPQGSSALPSLGPDASGDALY